MQKPLGPRRTWLLGGGEGTGSTRFVHLKLELKRTDDTEPAVLHMRNSSWNCFRTLKKDLMFVSLQIFTSASWRDPPPQITTNRRLRSVARVCWVEFLPPRAPFASAFFKTFALDPGQEFHLELPDRELRPSLRVPWRGRPWGFSCVSARILFFLPFQKFYFGLS